MNDEEKEMAKEMLINKKNINNLRVIYTARNKQKINEAAKKGFKPLLQQVIPSDEIKSKYAVWQNKITGEIDVVGDYRGGNHNNYEKVIDFTFYYPYKFESPFAAYLLPKDLEIGERVFLEDLIEDYVGTYWNQGDAYRLEYSEAIWNGINFDIQDNEEDMLRPIIMIG